MNPIRRKRLILIGIMVAGVGIAVGFALNAFNQNMMFYYSPSEVMNGKAPAHARIRMGGVVVDGSFKRIEKSIRAQFDVTDGGNTIKVEYEGVLPDLFREGQVILAKGELNKDGLFVADEVLAKHDENYMPREVADSLQQAAKAKAAKAN